MNLTQVSVGVHKRKKKKRVGRGIGSGHGKTAGRGHKGQYSSAGANLPGALFEGGQTPHYRRIPKRGFSNAAFRRTIVAINVGDLDRLFAEGDTVDPQSLRQKGLANGVFDGIKILGEGEVTKKLKVRVHHISASAKAKIEAKGGTFEQIPPPKKPVRNKMKPRPPKAKK